MRRVLQWIARWVRAIPTKELTRIQKLRILKKFYLENLVEDPIDGTSFDCNFLDALVELERKENELPQH